MSLTTNTLLITGASSYVGARIYFDLQNKYKLVGTCLNNRLSASFIKLNLTNKEAIEQLLDQVRPAVIVHVANYPSPSDVVNNEENFVALNGKTTKDLVEGANRTGAKMVFISSQAANNPDNLYAQLKAKSEELVKTVKAGYLILRPSMIIGFSPNTRNDRMFNRILRCLENKAKGAEFDTSWKLQPTYIGHLPQVIDITIQDNAWDKTVPVFINEIVTQHQIAQDILDYFSISVGQIDKKINIPISEDDLTYFNSLNLHPKTYHEMIVTIVEEIRSRDKFSV